MRFGAVGLSWRISIVFNLVQTMLDCRQNILTSINTILRRIALFQNRPEEKHLVRFLNSLTTEVELLRNDLVLVCNQNFYLRCKLDQREQQLQSAEKKLAETTSRMQLSLQMARIKYEKQIQALKFSRFISRDPQDLSLPPPQSYSSAAKEYPTSDQQLKQEQQIATVKKHKEFNELRCSAVRETGTGEQRETGECPFDLQLRGLSSEQQVLFSNNRLSVEMARSNEVEEEQSKKRRGRASSSRKEESVSAHPQRKKKSEELAQLVAMQFKVQPIKQKYFSTDLF